MNILWPPVTIDEKAGIKWDLLKTCDNPKKIKLIREDPA
jgi:hypothetical protein